MRARRRGEASCAGAAGAPSGGTTIPQLTDDERAFEAMCLELRPVLRREAARRVGPDEADDLVQDTLWRAWRHRGGFDPQRGTAVAWVLAIARNAAVDRARRSARAEMALDELRAARAAAPPPGPEEAALAGARGAELRRAVAGLRDEQRAALWQVYWLQRSHAEVARLTSLPLGTVKSRVRAGLATLRPELEAGPDRTPR